MNQRTLGNRRPMKVILVILKKYHDALIICTGFSIGAAALSMHLVPKSYKSRVVLSIHPTYFQNPLEHDIDTPEIMKCRSLRELIVTKALNGNFLEELDQKHHLLNRDKGSHLFGPKLTQSTEEQELLRRRFEVLCLNSMTFQVSFTATQPETAFLVIQESTRRILSFLEKSKRADPASENWKLMLSNSDIGEELLRKRHELKVTSDSENHKNNTQILVIEAPVLYPRPILPILDTILSWSIGGGLMIFLLGVLGAEWLYQQRHRRI